LRTVLRADGSRIVYAYPVGGTYNVSTSTGWARSRHWWTGGKFTLARRPEQAPGEPALGRPHLGDSERPPFCAVRAEAIGMSTLASRAPVPFATDARVVCW